MKVFLGIGNGLRQDDGFGVHVVRELERELSDRDDCIFIECGVAPVSFLGKVPEEPEELFLVDVLRKKDLEPGECILMEVEKFKSKEPVSTHRLPFSVIQDSLNPGKTYLAGTKPVENGFGETMSREATEAKDKLVKKIKSFLD